METSLHGRALNDSYLSNASANHLVSFYPQDADLIDELDGYIYAGVSGGDGCIVIATPEHRHALNERLASLGVDLERAASDQTYIALDAEETLAAFMDNDWPDAEKFQKVIRRVLMTARGPGRNVRAFGEMVAILWGNGLQDAAIRLEYLWNDLIRSESLHLFCAYPARFFNRDGAEGFPSVCAAHSLCLGIESVTSQKVN
jgi:hypothetical protein